MIEAREIRFAHGKSRFAGLMRALAGVGPTTEEGPDDTKPGHTARQARQRRELTVPEPDRHGPALGRNFSFTVSERFPLLELNPSVFWKAAF